MKRTKGARHPGAWHLLPLLFVFSFQVFASEVLDQTSTQVVIRNHPKTGKPYVGIVPSEKIPADPFTGRKKFTAPDYRLLDPHFKSKDISYDGPYSDRKKVYIFAAGLATVGTVGGAIGLAMAPAATGAAASGGAGAYMAGAGAVTAGTAGSAYVATRSDPHQDDSIHTAESKKSASDDSDSGGDSKEEVNS